MAEKPMPMIAVVKNVWKKEVRRTCDGFAYIWKPGEEKQMSVELAHFFAGDPTLEKPKEVYQEKMRVMQYYSEDDRPLGNPLVIERKIDPNDAPEVVEEEAVVVVDSKEDEEEPFADLADDGLVVNAPRSKGRPKKAG